MPRPRNIRLLPCKFTDFPRQQAIEILEFVYGMTFKEASAQLEAGNDAGGAELYVTNYARGPSEYQVFVRRGPNVPKQRHMGVELVEIEVRTIDGSGIFDWRDLYGIKNAVMGPESEAIELFPAQDRLIGTRNVRYIYAVAGNNRIAIGHG